jgi:hypothetical protein
MYYIKPMDVLGFASLVTPALPLLKYDSLYDAISKMNPNSPLIVDGELEKIADEIDDFSAKTRPMGAWDGSFAPFDGSGGWHGSFTMPDDVSERVSYMEYVAMCLPDEDD